ncbi:MAG: hypothetical protein ACTSWG_13375 [Candidatus Helarchaeota archaeon]
MEFITKVWGWEEILENNSKYCLKKLCFNYRWRNSWHRHFKKDETFYVIQGKFHLITLTDNEKFKEGLLIPGNVVRIQPKTWHRLTGLDFHNEVIEASTYFDETDIERVDKGYEIYGTEECKLNNKERYIK